MNVILLKSAIGSKGGLEKITKRFIAALIQKGDSVTLLTTTSSKKPLPDLHPQLKVVVLALEGPFSFWNLFYFDYKVKQWLKKNPHEIVFGFDRNSWQTHIRAGNGCHAAYLKLRKESLLKRLIFKINPLHRTLLYLEKKGFEHPCLKILFTNSHLVKRQILQYYKVPPEKIEVLYNAVEWTDLQKPFDDTFKVRAEYRLKWGIPHDHFLLLFAGHGYKRKGLPLLIEALKSYPKVTLVVVGKDRSPPKISSQVRIFGPQESLIPFLQTADALCIPSLYDPFANVTLEALSMGLFICSSAFNGGSEILTPSTGVVIDDLFSLTSFCKALDITCANPKTPLSAASIRESVKGFDFAKQMQKMVSYAR